MRLLTAVSGVRVPQQAPFERNRKCGFFLFYSLSSNPLTLFSPCTTFACRSDGENSLFRHFVPYGGSSPSTGARKHLIKGAFFLLCFGTRTPRALRAFGAAEMTLRTPHWTRSALRATIAIPSLRSLRGFESLSGSPPKVFSVGLFQAPESTLLTVLFSCPVLGQEPRALCALSAQPK